MLNKMCRQCNSQFIVEDEDLSFYKKISPAFAGKTYEVPPPTLCPKCRDQRRCVWRNYRTLYRRKCDLCKKDIVTSFSPDKPYTVYCQECWWSDKWDPLSYGTNFDFSKPFFEQFDQLLKKVPRIALLNKNPENSEFCTYAGNNKDCYLMVNGCWHCDSCSYGTRVDKCRECVDNQMLSDSELCYETTFSSNLYKCLFCHYCFGSKECYFSSNLRGCDHCVFSTNLRNKSYFAYDKPCAKEEFEEIVEKIGDHNSLQRMKAKFKEITENSFYPPVVQDNCENCQGDNLYDCKNVRHTYDGFDLEDTKYFVVGQSARDCMDCTYVGIDNTQLIYEGLSVGLAAYHCLFDQSNWTTRDTYYCDTLMSCNNCFGSTSLKHKNFCILNKKYTPEEYEKEVSKIIKHMTKTNEWGEFFPYFVNVFSYNETVANEFYPLTKEGALRIGAKWQDDDFSSKFEGDIYKIKDRIEDYLESEDEIKRVLAGVIKCEKTDKPFKITANEMTFYLKNRIVLPKVHYSVRFEDRFKILNPCQLWSRQCMCKEKDHGHEGRCKNEFETTYAPDRPEKVYCEDCYQRSIV